MKNKQFYYKRLIVAFAVFSSIVLCFLNNDYMTEFPDNWVILKASTNDESATAVTAVIDWSKSIYIVLLSALLPGIIPIIVTIFAWRKRCIGGGIFIVLAIICGVVNFLHILTYSLMSSAVILGAIGILFLWHYWKYPRKRRKRI